MARLTHQDVEERLYRTGLRNLIETNRPFRQFVLQIVEFGGIYSTTHLAGHPDTSAYSEGRRSLALDVLIELQRVDPLILATLVKDEGLRIKEREPAPSPDNEDEE